MLGDGKTSYDHDHDNQATVAGTGCQVYNHFILFYFVPSSILEQKNFSKLKLHTQNLKF